MRIVRRLLGRDPAFAPNTCYGQDGEDLVLDRMLERQAQGFYVDVGAHHPVRFSNTYLFYLRGWQGINIDAQPGSMLPFRQWRDRDTNIECGIAGAAGALPYYQFNEPALNTFDKAEAELKNHPPYRLVNTVEVPVRRLDEVLDEFMPASTSIDFLSVDVEGKDHEVLASSNWSRYRPRFVVAETLRTDLLQLGTCPVVQLLASVGYRPVAKVYNSTFFERVSS